MGKKRLMKIDSNISWKGKKYGNEYNIWYNINNFGDAKNAIQNFEKFNAHFPTRPRRKPALSVTHQKQYILPVFLFARRRRRRTGFWFNESIELFQKRVCCYK